MTNEKDLADALKKGQDTIEVEFDLAKKVIKIKAVGNVAWGICVGGIAVAVISVISAPASGGLSIPVAATLAVPTVSVLGLSTTTTALAIAVAGGGVGVLNQLREYRIEKISDTKAILHKK